MNLAAGTVSPPRLLLLDEPVSALDPANREAVLDLIAGLTDDGVAVLAVFHDLDVIRRLADRVVVLRSWPDDDRKERRLRLLEKVEPREEEFSITDVRAVLADRIVDDATVVVEDGVISAVGSGSPATTRTVHDGAGAFLLPGLSTRTATASSERSGRDRRRRSPSTSPSGSFEGRLRAAGVTTVFHGVGFHEKPSYHRTIDQAVELCEEIGKRRASADVPCDHRVLHRLEAREDRGWEELLRPTSRSVRWAQPLPLLSFEDHSPGQGQFRDLEKFKRSGGFDGATGAELDRLVARVRR